MIKLISRYVSEHEHGLVHLTFLRDAIARIINKGSNDQDLKMVQDSLAFLAGDLVEHCKKEESELYPLMKDLIAPEILWKLCEEHDIINSKLIEIQIILETLKNSESNVQQKHKVKAESDSFIDLLYTHIKEENNLMNTVLSNIKSERKYNEKKTIKI